MGEGGPTRGDDDWEWSQDRNANEKGTSILVIRGKNRGRYDLFGYFMRNELVFFLLAVVSFSLCAIVFMIRFPHSYLDTRYSD